MTTTATAASAPTMKRASAAEIRGGAPPGACARGLPSGSLSNIAEPILPAQVPSYDPTYVALRVRSPDADSAVHDRAARHCTSRQADGAPRHVPGGHHAFQAHHRPGPDDRARCGGG